LSAGVAEPQPYEIEVAEEALVDLRARLRATRWAVQPAGDGWNWGVDHQWLRELCGFWAEEYDWRATETGLNGLSNWTWDGLHFIWERAVHANGPPKPPVLLVHGWPGAPLEFLDLIALLVDAGHDVVVPSLPGYAFSAAPDPPLNIAGMAARLRSLMEGALGYERYFVQGGDWGSAIAARIGFDSPQRVAGIHLNSPSVLPFAASLDDPPLTGPEQEWLATAARWRTRHGYHLLVQGAAPDAFSPGLTDSPAGLAAWLVEKYRNWSDCDGEVERRFSRNEICDFCSIYWLTGTIASSMRLYAAEARERWRLAEGERVEAPAAVADFPAEILHPPREWAERVLGDLRSWTTMPRGGHFAAFEEPELLAEDLLAFIDGI